MVLYKIFSQSGSYNMYRLYYIEQDFAKIATVLCIFCVIL